MVSKLLWEVKLRFLVDDCVTKALKLKLSKFLIGDPVEAAVGVLKNDFLMRNLLSIATGPHFYSCRTNAS